MKALNALFDRTDAIPARAPQAAPAPRGADIETLLPDGNSRTRHHVPDKPWSDAMLISYLLGLALLLLAGLASAENDWQLIGQDREELVFIDRAAIAPATPASGTVKAWVLKSALASTTLGDDWYPHRSKKLLVEVRCEDRAMRVSEWIFTEGALGHGRPVWADNSPVTALNPAPAGSTDSLIAARVCEEKTSIAAENIRVGG
jgi:hypothetical protein